MVMPGNFPRAGNGTDGDGLGEIRAENVVKAFRHHDGTEVAALSGVELRVRAGEFVSLIGPSGCGKSTLLRLIAGLIQPNSGRLSIDGAEIAGPDWEKGLVFQNPLLFPWMNIRDNVAFGLRARKVYRERKNEVETFLKLVGLEKFGRSYPHQLSGGMAQRASLARALVNRPRVLLMDEPLGALDAFTRMNMQDEILRIWRERKTTMVMVTHDVDEALYLSDRVVVMSPGPGRIDTAIYIPFSRPRARSDPDFLHLRATILKILNFGGQSREPNYQI
ncbi:MAG: ABC transporter ATP-binding protein [Planctomycetota bacterium]|jgi:NitT/TauT family transport system ATP-binding protein/sulfonate transport system ATP-binding protein|nr:ABC transporter ATP-binding protein [Planctomycetota bacterium]